MTTRIKKLCLYVILLGVLSANSIALASEISGVLSSVASSLPITGQISGSVLASANVSTSVDTVSNSSSGGSANMNGRRHVVSSENIVVNNSQGLNELEGVEFIVFSQSQLTSNISPESETTYEEPEEDSVATTTLASAVSPADININQAAGVGAISQINWRLWSTMVGILGLATIITYFVTMKGHTGSSV